MSRVRRIILLLGAGGILHSSLVPPMQQTAGSVCRYEAFMARRWPFTHGYGVGEGDVPALLTEYGLVLAFTAAAWLAAGWLEGRSAPGGHTSGGKAEPEGGA